MFGIHFAESFGKPHGVVLRDGEDDGLSGKLAGCVFETHIHELFPLSLEGVLVRDLPLKVRSLVIDVIWVDSSFAHRFLAFFRQIHSLDALALEFPCGPWSPRSSGGGRRPRTGGPRSTATAAVITIEK